MKIFELSNAQAAATGFTHRFEITFADCTTAGAAQTISLAAYTARMGVTAAAFKLVSGWVGPSITNVTLELGWNGAAVDDPNGLIEAAELATAGTEILAGDGTGAAFATKRTGFFAQEAGAFEAVLTASGANINVNTAGEVHVYMRIVDLTKV